MLLLSIILIIIQIPLLVLNIYSAFVVSSSFIIYALINCIGIAACLMTINMKTS